MKIFYTSLIFLFFLGCQSTKSEGQKSQTIEQKQQFILQNFDGTTLTLVRKNSGFEVKGYEEKILMLDIFATYCPPCRAEAEDLKKLQMKYKDQLIVVGLTIEKNLDATTALKFVDKYKAGNFISMNYADNEVLINDILKSIDYNKRLTIPLKVILKNGTYLKLHNVANKEGYYYLGQVYPEIITKDLEAIFAKFLPNYKYFKTH